MNAYLEALGNFEDNITIKEYISSGDIAVIGMSGKFGPSGDLDQFWESISSGEDLAQELPETRKRDVEKYLRKVGLWRQDNNFKQASYLNEIDKFDHSFFGISPKEACLMDPSQRIFLQTAWSAIEDAGYSSQSLSGKRIGTFVGYSDDMLYKQLIQTMDPNSIPLSVPGNVRSMMAGRIAYLLDFRGPSMVIDTACSSALVAVHLACNAIKNGECDMAISGSAKIFLSPMQKGALFMEGVMSSDGRTRSYDINAGGFGLGEGTGAVVLKSLKKAIADNDNIYAVIKGSAISQDGMSIGITAPNQQAQEEVIQRAWKMAKLEPAALSYIEGHGSATELGDAIELKALGNILGKRKDKRSYCVVGSVKSNLGHLDHAAGIAGLLKALLAIKNKKIPPTVYFSKLNEKIAEEQLPIYINRHLMDWQSENTSRVCGVSSFGISGTNCHIVLQEHKSSNDEEADSSIHLFTISAKTQQALLELANAYVTYLKKQNLPKIGDICYTANAGRNQYMFRIALTCKSVLDLQMRLEQIIQTNRFDQPMLLDKNSKKTEQERKTIQDDCKTLLSQWVGGQPSDSKLLQQICELYTKGADINWELFYQHKKYRRVSLPTYPFASTRCWLEADECQIYHRVIWEEQALPVYDRDNSNMGDVLILSDHTGIADQLEKLMLQDGRNVIMAEFGLSYRELGDRKFIISPSGQDFNLLAGYVNWNKISHILYCSSITRNTVNTLENLNDKLQIGVLGVFRLLKEMLRQSLNTCELILIGDNTYPITKDEDNLHPENATMFGLSKVINLEYPHIISRSLDITLDVNIQDVYNEIFYGDNKIFMTAFRKKNRYIQKLQELKKDDLTLREVSIKENGVYIVTGGTGGIGLEICKLLSSQQRVNLLLINRTQFPSKDEWPELSTNTDEKIRSCIQTFQEIERQNSTVTLYHADVSNEEEMSRVFADITRRFHNIDGVIHCAGSPGNSFVINKDESSFQKVLAPKVAGTWLLHNLTRNFNMDFFLMFSSVTAVTGAPGQSDYCAANNYMDAFSGYRNQLGIPTLSIDWTQWKNIGMGANFVMNEDDELFQSISVADAVNTLDQMWNLCADTLVVGELNSRFVSKKAGSTMIETIKERYIEETKVFSNLHVKSISTQNISLNGKENERYTNYEKMIASIWREVLGYDAFNIHDSFFDIGGDSLKLRNVHRRLDEQLSGKATIVDLFTYSTIYQLARFLDETKRETSTNEKPLTDELQVLVDNLKSGTKNLEQVMDRFNTLR